MAPQEKFKPSVGSLGKDDIKELKKELTLKSESPFMEIALSRRNRLLTSMFFSRCSTTQL